MKKQQLAHENALKSNKKRNKNDNQHGENQINMFDTHKFTL